MINKRSIRVLHVEDSAPDVVLLERYLHQAGYDLYSQRVDTADDMKNALGADEWDIILCDYSMPHFNALGALAVLHASGLDIPLIIISGTVGEEVAVEALLGGANDYMPKDNLARLVPAIDRELKEAANRKELREAAEARRRTDERYHTLFACAPDGIIISSPESYYLNANASMCTMLGYEQDELIGMHAADIVSGSEVKYLDSAIAEVQSMSGYKEEWRFKRKDGTKFTGEVIATIMPDGNLLAMVRDVTERLEAEARVRHSEAQLTEAQRLAHIGSWDWDLNTTALAWSDELYRMFGAAVGAHVDFEYLTERVHPDDLPLFTAIVQKSWDTLESFDLHLRIVRADGVTRVIHSLGSVAVDEQGNAVRMYGTAQDVTEIQMAKTQQAVFMAEIERQHERLDSIVANVPGIVWEASGPVGMGHSGTHFVSSHVTTWLGYSTLEWLKTPDFWLSIVHPDDRERVRSEAAAAFAVGGDCVLEFRWITKSGEVTWAETRSATVIDEAGDSIGVRGVTIDITERKRTEEHLAELSRVKSETAALLDTILSSAPIGFAFHNPDLTFGRINGRMAAINGLSVDDHIGRTLRETVPDLADLVEDRLNSVLKTGEAVIDMEITGRTPGDPEQARSWLASFYRVGEVNSEILGVGVLVTDMTERKRAEEALAESARIIRESEQRYRLLFEQNPQPMWVYDTNSLTFLEVNEAAIRHYGYTRREFLSMTIKDIRPVNELPRLLSSIRKENADLVKGEWTHQRKDGSQIDVEITSHELAFGGVPARLVLAKDITQTNYALAALSASEERYRDLVENAIDLIYTHDLEGNYTSVNRASERITGYTNAEALAMNLSDTVAPYDLARARAMLAAKLAGNDVTAYELDIVAKDGHLVTVEVNTRLIYENGVRVGVQGIARDVTERKVLEAQLERQRAEHEVVLNSIGEGVHWIDLDGQIKFENPAGARMLGYEISELIGKPSHPTIHHTRSDGTAYPRSECGIYATLQDGLVRRVTDEVFWRKDGTSFAVEYVCTPISDHNGDLRGSVVVFADVTERRRAEAEASWLLSVLEGTLNEIYIFDADTLRFEYVNECARANLGYSMEAMQRLTPLDLKPEFTEADFQKLVGPLRRDETPKIVFETVHRRADDSLYPVEVHLQLVDQHGKSVFLAVITDITERRAAGAELEALSMRTERRERMLTSLLSSITDFAQIYNPDGQILFANQPLLDLWGKSLDEVIGKDFHDLEYPDDLAEKLKAQLRQVFTTRESVVDETPFVGASGSMGYYEYIFSPAIGPGGDVDFVVGSTRDVTERKIAEDRLRSSEEDLSRSQRIAQLGSWEVDVPDTESMNGGDLRWSEEVFRIFGYHPFEIEVSNEFFYNAVHPDDRALVVDAMTTALQEGTDFKIDFRILHPDGSERVVHEHSETVLDPINGRLARIVGTIQDITEQKKLESELRQSQKMEAVGVLAGGIAHDFNNLLTAINGYSDLTLRRMASDDPLRRNIDEIRTAGDRATELTSQLLAFSRKQVLKPIVHNLNSVISNIEKMLRRIIRESVELRTVLDPDLVNIKADPGQIEQVIMNLSINARDAMPDGGILTIETSSVYLDEDYVSQYLSVSPGEFVKLTVTDTGEGMLDDVQKHIFEPFFTTKEIGKGTGLGLSTVYGIVKQSGGDIMVYSEVGHGTTFKIYLPSVNESVQKPKWTGDRRGYLGSETILLVEDEPIVRQLVFEILVSNGYTVLDASSGKDALEICKTYAQPIHMLLTDVIMPRMGGGELRDSVLKLFPEIRVLFMSGYTDDSVALRGVFSSNIEYIEKPFTPDGLSRKVREVLGY